MPYQDFKILQYGLSILLQWDNIATISFKYENHVSDSLFLPCKINTKVTENDRA